MLTFALLNSSYNRFSIETKITVQDMTLTDLPFSFEFALPHTVFNP